MTDTPNAAPASPAALPADPGQALSAGSLDVTALLDTAAAGPLSMLDADLAAKTEELAQGLAKSRPEVAIARALALLTMECRRWYDAYTGETKRASDFAIEIADVLDPVVPAQLDAKNRLAAAAVVLVDRVKTLEARVAELEAAGPAIPATHQGEVAPRELTAHVINGCNLALFVQAIDVPGPGGASHLYEIAVMEPAPVDDQAAADGVTGRRVAKLSVILPFQKGPVKETGDGTNGITHEAMLAVLLDRLAGFQAGPYACPENAKAHEHLVQALGWLNERTKAREQRVVEGTSAV